MELGLNGKVAAIVLGGGLEGVVGKKIVELQLPEGAKVRDAIVSLKEAQVEHASAVLNSQRVSENQELKEGDVLYVFRPIAGG